MIVSSGPFWYLVYLLNVLLPGGDTKRKDDAVARACGERLDKNDGNDCVLWPFWCRGCLLIVLLPGGVTKRKDDAFARAWNE